MRNRFILFAIALATLSLLGVADATAASLSSSLKNSLDKAYSTSDSFVLESVVTSAKARYPHLRTEIDTHIAGLENAAIAEKQAAKNAELAKKDWKGSVEAGATYSTGNTEKENLNFATKLTKEGEKWGHTAKFSAYGSKDSDVRSKEEYRAEGQTRYNLSDVDYVFGELGYVNDRFSGFNYRLNEGVGYGYKFYNTDDFKLAGEASIGARQSEKTDGDKEESILGKAAGKLEWKIADGISLTEDLSIAVADSTITRSETAIKSSLTDTLYLKLGLDIENNSDVPAGRDDTDTKTTLSVGYDF